MSLQAHFDQLFAAWQRERAQTQMTLGELISELKELPADAHVPALVSAHSYRGYYMDLAFELETGTRSAADLLDDCHSVLDTELDGYKGGKFRMTRTTPVWVAAYGCTGQRLMRVHPELVTAPDPVYSS